MEGKIFVSVVQIAKVKYVCFDLSATCLLYPIHCHLYILWTIFAKERIFSASKCCDKLLVEGGGDAMEKQPVIYHSFALEADLWNGHAHYTSQDKTMAIAYDPANKMWRIQEAENR